MTETITRPSMKAIIKAVRQVIQEDGQMPTKEFIRDQVQQAVERSVKSKSWPPEEVDSMVARVVKQEVLRCIGELGWGTAQRPTVDGRKAASEKFDDYVRKIVEKHVRSTIKELVLDALTIDIGISGRAFVPARGTRPVNIEEED